MSLTATPTATLPAIFALLLLPALPAAARQVDLELVLLADATGSITAEEIAFQRQGYASAITHPEVLAAIAGTAYGSIALTYVEWGQADSQHVVVPWTVIAGPEEAATFAEGLVAGPRAAFGRNAIGAALLFGKGLIEGNEIEGWRRIIDVSADSANNHNGPDIAAARDEVLAAGITINGLAVACRGCAQGWSTAQGLQQAFAERIIGGPGAFVVTAETEATFAEAVRRKLILEISGLHGHPVLAARPAAPAVPGAPLAAPRPDN